MPSDTLQSIVALRAIGWFCENTWYIITLVCDDVVCLSTSVIARLVAFNLFWLPGGWGWHIFIIPRLLYHLVEEPLEGLLCFDLACTYAIGWIYWECLGFYSQATSVEFTIVIEAKFKRTLGRTIGHFARRHRLVWVLISCGGPHSIVSISIYTGLPHYLSFKDSIGVHTSISCLSISETLVRPHWCCLIWETSLITSRHLFYFYNLMHLI